MNSDLEYSYSVGYKKITSNNEELILTSFNTALLSYMKKTISEDKMWIGLEQVKSLIGNNILPTKDCFAIAIFHHPSRYLSSHELCSYDNRQATLPLLQKNVDLILCGHTETGDKPIINKQKDGGSILTGGATYYSDSHPNSFSIIEVKEKKKFDVVSYQYNSICGWHKFDEPNISIPDENGFCDKSTMFSDCKLEFNYDQLKREIDLKVMVEEQNSSHCLKMSNKKHVTRNVDVSIVCKSDKSFDFKIELPNKKRNNIESILEREKIYNYSNEFADSKDPLKKICLKSNEKIIISADNLSCSDEYDNETINILEELRKIENYFDAKFICPETVYQLDDKYRKELINFIEKGYSIISSLRPDKIELSINNVDTLKSIYSMMNKSNCTYLYRLEKELPILYDATLEDEDLAYVFGKYSVNLNDLKFKIDTFVKGDVRLVEFISISTADTYVTKFEHLKIIEEKGENMMEIPNS